MIVKKKFWVILLALGIGLSILYVYLKWNQKTVLAENEEPPIPLGDNPT